MFRYALFCLATCLAGASAAQDAPALYDVTGVAGDDQLNIRAAPEPGAAQIGTLAPDATDIEITAINEAGTWGRLNTGEGSGWASLSFLAMQPGSAMPDAAEVGCFGNEPFWSYRVESDKVATFSALGEDPLDLLAGETRRVEAGLHPFVSVAAAPDLQAILVMTPDAACSDGMSDRLYGLDATLILTGKISRAVTGCCTLTPN
ncbi:peptide-binding protein [Salipiger bermudensis]|uniref:peptide-binding protein n=1 Tax=Salipiger bermudensis TaxID=344736 RepID=UPI001C992E4E|nr:peptide-binding protein [Salipiger bermudensis]MBY6003802.1 peptide-binding protein [Salipiger bermudensis]